MLPQKEKDPFVLCEEKCHHPCDPNCPIVIAEVKALVARVTGIPVPIPAKPTPQPPNESLLSVEEGIEKTLLAGFDWLFRL